jgi:hypothetical protein
MVKRTTAANRNHPYKNTSGALRGTKTGNATIDALAKRMDSVLSRIPRGTFAKVGGVMGGPRGAMIGAGLSKISGYGDYTVTANTLTNRGTATVADLGVPDFLPDTNGTKGLGIRLRHREYIGDVTVPSDPSAFRSRNFKIDPSNGTMFPWLSTIASKYQKYKVHGMVVVYRSTSTDYNNSGTVAMVANYDPGESGFETLSGVLNSKFAISTKPSANVIMPLECDPATMPNGGYFIDHGLTVGVDDVRLEQFASLQLITQGLSLDTGTVLGQIYVTYDIELLYPFTNVSVGLQTQTANYKVPGVRAITPSAVADRIYGNGDMVTVDPCWGRFYTELNADQPFVTGTGAGNVVRFSQSGVYQVSVAFQGNTMAFPENSHYCPILRLGKNCRFVSIVGPATATRDYPPAISPAGFPGNDDNIVIDFNTAGNALFNSSNNYAGQCSVTFLVKVLASTAVFDENLLGDSWVNVFHGMFAGATPYAASSEVVITKI